MEKIFKQFEQDYNQASSSNEKLSIICKFINTSSLDELLLWYDSDNNMLYKRFRKHLFNFLLKQKRYYVILWHLILRKSKILQLLLRKHGYIKPKEYFMGKPLFFMFKQEFSKTEEIFHNINNYINVYGSLNDEDSKETLCDVIMARLMFNFEYYEKSNLRSGEQYFEHEIIDCNSKEVFVDCGGYIGDTAMEFIRFANNEYSKIYIYEPDKDNVRKAKVNLKEFPNVVIREAGVSNENTTIGFLGGRKSSSRMSDNAGSVVNVVAIDNDINEEITFIKMDIEGEEAAAILGAQRHISEEKPKLAICVYHKDSDIWYLFEMINKINPNYRYHLRHYSNDSTETVLYTV